jgi:hypothetical protein
VIAPIRIAEEILRGRPWASLAGVRPGVALGRLVLVLVCFGSGYGAVMGSFGGFRPGQVAGSATKVPLLLGATTALAVPSFYVLHALLGLRADFGRALRSLVSAQATLTIVLASLAPLTVVWYASTTNYRSAILFNAVIFGAASLGAQIQLRRSYRALIARDRRHRLLLRAWLVIFAFVGIQMGWLLRPFIGDPAKPVEFFRSGRQGNAYEFLAGLVLDAIG